MECFLPYQQNQSDGAESGTELCTLNGQKMQHGGVAAVAAFVISLSITETECLHCWFCL